jgi:ABC-2 type transport system ATP-binding protein
VELSGGAAGGERDAGVDAHSYSFGEQNGAAQRMLGRMGGAYAVEARNLVKVYRGGFGRREVRALDGVSFQAPAGTAFGLLGPNGAGKTTFVKSLLASVHPTSGSAWVFGRDSRENEARRPIGYLPENHRFPTYFTGEGMLDLYGSLSGMEWRERKRRIPELLELVGLKGWGGTRLGKYSKGMLQRVGLAQALMHKPRLLVLDEPTDGVDPVGRIEIRRILQQLEGTGVTVFLNSHQLGEVEMYCSQVAILHKGRVALTGNVRELTTDKGYRLTVPNEAPEMPEALRARLEAGAAAVGTRNGVASFQFATREAANEGIDACREARHPVEALEPTRSTLEEIFIRTVEGSGR